MAYNDEDDSREDLYRRFKLSLGKPATERFFDEDELAEVFDYAGDLDDFYVRFEALCLGARLYPDSTALADRRALLYFDEDDRDDTVRRFISDNSRLDTPIIHFLALELSHPDPEDVPESLDFLVDQFASFTDEEIIRLVDLAVDLGQYRWLTANLDKLRKKVSFLPSLLYEILNEADSQGDDATAIRLADELVEIEPFSATYWIALFRAHARAGHEADARNAFDYAKALVSPDDAETNEWLAESVINYALYLRDEELEILDGLIAKFPREFTFTDYRTALLLHAERVGEAVEGLKDYLRKFPDNMGALRRLLSFNLPDSTEYIEAFYKAAPGGFGEQALDETVSALHMNNALVSLHLLMQIAVLKEESMNETHVGTWIEAIYAMGNFTMAAFLADTLQHADYITEQPLRGAGVSAAVVLSYMKTGQSEKALKFIDATEKPFRLALTVAPLAVRLTMHALLDLYEKVREKKDDTAYWQDYDIAGDYRSPGPDPAD